MQVIQVLHHEWIYPALPISTLSDYTHPRRERESGTMGGKQKSIELGFRHKSVCNRFAFTRRASAGKPDVNHCRNDDSGLCAFIESDKVDLIEP
jgi:hypothetical protein